MNTSILNENNQVKRSKKLIDRITVGGKLYFMAVIPDLKRKSEYAFYNCSCPFRRDKNPSLSITGNPANNTWYYKDFGDVSLQGNMYDFAAHRHGLDSKVDFSALLEKIYQELGIDQMDKEKLQRLSDGGTGTNETIYYGLKISTLNNNNYVSTEDSEFEEKKKDIYEIVLHHIEENDLDSSHKDFLARTGIKYEIMKKHNAFFIKGYAILYGEGGYDDTVTKKKPKNEIWICYSFETYNKIYSAISKRFWYVGNKPHDYKYIFGTPNLNIHLNNEIVLIAAGEKDTLSLLSRGYHAFCLNSETMPITLQNYEQWKNKWGYQPVLIYDIDKTGITQAQKINAETGIPFVTLPLWLEDKGGKDTTDFFEQGGTKEELDSLIEVALNDTKSCENSVIKLLPVRTAAQRIQDAQLQPDILPHADVLFQSYELTVLFGDTGKGKSLFAVALANAISKGIEFLGLENKCSPLPVLYYDFELSDKQFEKRYTDENGHPYVFNDRFFIDNINLSEIDFKKFKIPFEELLIEKIKADINAVEAKVLIIDNISFLSTFSAEDSQVAMRLMKLLKELKTNESISILVLAHTPKKFGIGGMSLQDLAGSKHLSNFCDSVFALGESKKDSNIRYIVQVKPSRTGEIKYDSKNVILCEIQKLDSFLTFIFRGYANEADHLHTNSADIENEMIEKAKEMHREGKTYRQIADELKVVSKSTVGRWLKPDDI